LKVKELQAKGKIEIDDLKKEIKETEKEQKRLGTGILFLSWGGAVIIPCIFFRISFLNAVYGINLEGDYLSILSVSARAFMREKQEKQNVG